MNRLNFAIHRYEELVSLDREQSAHHGDHWAAWLRDDVLPAIEASLCRPCFRTRARWPLVTLRPEAETPERQIVEQFQQQLKSMAEVLAEGIQSTSLQDRRRQQLRLVSAESSPEAFARTSLPRDFMLRGSLEDPSLFETQVYQVISAASAPPHQLINLSDYLLPKQGLFEILDFQNPSAGNAFIVSSPNSLPIGNHLLRRPLAEVRWRSRAIDAVRTRVQQELSSWSSQQLHIDQAWIEFHKSYQSLQQMFHPSDELALIESCVACTQLYAAINPSPDLSWLGLPEPTIASEIAGLNQRLRRYWGSEIHHRIVNHLETLRRLPATAETALEEAIATGGLVINQTAGTAYWRGVETKNLTHAQFRFLVALGCAGLHHRLCGFRDVFGNEDVTESNLSTSLGRLKSRLPRDLRPFIVSGPHGSKTYQLTLPPEQIHLLKN